MPYITVNVALDHPDTEPCETCGYSWDELEITWDIGGDAEIVFEGRYSVGCYGGSSYTGDKPGLVQWLVEIIDQYSFDDGTGRKQDLIETLYFLNRNY